MENTPAELSYNAIICQNRNGMIAGWNPAAASLYGYLAHEVLGQAIDVLIPTDRRAEHARVLQLILGGRSVHSYHTEWVDKNHLRLSVAVTPEPITDERGAIVGLSSASRMLTARQRIEDRLRVIADAAPDSVVGVDPDGRIMLVNLRAERQFGYARAELIGQPVEILVPEQHRAAHPAHRAGFQTDPQRRGVGTGRRLSARRRDGTEFPAEISLTSVGTGTDIIAIAVVRDITQHFPTRR